MPRLQTFLYRLGEDGSVEAKIFFTDELDDLGDEWCDSPAKCAPTAAPTPVVQINTAKLTDAAVRSVSIGKQPDEFDGMDRDALVAALDAMDEKAHHRAADDTLRDKLRALTTEAAAG